MSRKLSNGINKHIEFYLLSVFIYFDKLLSVYGVLILTSILFVFLAN